MAQEGFTSAAVKTTADSGLNPVETQRNIPGKTPIQILHEYGTKTGSLPVYVMEKAEGEAHQPSFVSSVTIGDVSSTVQGMEFQQLLLEVGKALSTDNVKALAFLCTNILNRNTESVKSANDLFSRLVEQDHLSQERPYLLTELLRTIQRIDLVRKFHLNDGEPTSLISPYRKLLYNLSEELTDDDSSNVKFLLNDELPKRILDEKTSLLEVFLRMEQMNLLGDNNLNKLENIIHPVCPRLKVQITQFKAQQVIFSESSFTTLPLSTEASNSACSPGYLCSDTVDVSGSQENRTFSENQTSTNSKALRRYSMTQAKRGICLIINNCNFSRPSLKHREGTKVDEQCLSHVFKWLGFDVEVHLDCTSEKMLSVLRELGGRDHRQMDCVACCVLSHGLEGSVYGVDTQTVDIKVLKEPLNALNCPTLAEKPKLFFVQACQGQKEQDAVYIEADGPEPSLVCSDALKDSIPAEADFLMSMATVPSFVSFRDKKKGTWFIMMLQLLLHAEASSVSKSCDKSCFSGRCVNGSCACDHGWVGDRCQHCQGRFKLTDLSGSLTDGPVNYKYKTKCTWLIEGYPNAALRLRFNHFATECSWDHMYVYDGDSIYAPLIAVFSGLVVAESGGNETVPEVVTTSGYALLHFFSDAAYNLTGFTITYSINSCPNNCSGHGRCSTANLASGRVYCECEDYWKGDACDIPYCRDNCGSPDHGYCDLTGEKLCVCNDSWQGPDCSLSVPSTEAFWTLPSVKPSAQSSGRASHQALLHSGLMWVVGGYSFNYSNYHMVLNYNLESSTWDAVPVSSGPLHRYGHSLALHQDDIYMFGGKLESGPANVTDELWAFNIPRRTWSPRKPALPPPYALEGHTAHVVELSAGEAVMLIFFGYSPVYSYINKVQEYNIRSNSWQVVSAGGAVVQGGYGHSSVYDESSGCVFVHGGYKALNNNKYGLVDHMYRYHVPTRTWLILRESGLARHLHSAALLSGTVLVFGGNTHNDTSLSNGAKCFSADFLAYDIACDEWSILPRPSLHRDANRFGHSAVVSNGSMLIFGGFSGVLLNDVLTYTPPSCRAFSNPALCAAAGPGLRCHWVKTRCFPWEPKPPDQILPAVICPSRPDSTDEQCFRFSDCASCTANTWGCQWCEDRKCISSSSNCTVLTLELAQQHGGPLSLSPPPSMLSEHQLSLWKHGARRRGHSVRDSFRCKRREELECFRLANCRSCSLNVNCQWDQQQQECQALPGQLCGESWHHVDDACLRINSSKESYDNAQHYCKNLGGNIASLLTDKQVHFVLEELQRHQLQDKRLSPWVGLRKINVSYWGWEDASPFTNTSLRWSPGEPSDSGFCAYLEQPLVAGLKANPCTATTDGLICEKPAGSPQSPSARPCKTPCALRSSCSNCTSQAMECMWCSSAHRCVDSSAYVISFPYGQCLEWQTQDCSAQNCSGLRTCADCLESAECGWCGDPSNTGKGACTEGSYRGPLKPSSSRAGSRDRDMVLDQSLCTSDRGFNWAYIQCPACQCNGHSRCVNGSVCERCGNLTAGTHCQNCMAGYYGDPINGGKCNACKCNSHANVCHVNTGKCFCTTKGIKGDQCQLCDSENRYLGNPLRGTCYYNLLIDYQFTFSLLQEDDRHYTAINFMATPEQANKNLDMSINASNNFNLNITWSLSSTAGTISGEEMPIIARTNIREHRDSLSCEKFNFRLHHNITFYVYVSNFSWPIKIQIAFSQHNSIMDLVQFFVTFFSCFLSLLLVAAVVWKIKQTCWASRRREQLMRERQQMASRPFASVAVVLEVGGDQEELLQALPKPIAMEPCWGSRAGVLTVLLYLPRVPSGTPPPGQCGIAIASALVDASQQRAMDFKDRGLGLKHRKHTVHHQGTCV